MAEHWQGYAHHRCQTNDHIDIDSHIDKEQQCQSRSNRRDEGVFAVDV